ncbi:unnamed protein product [Amoebophrya sp. A120]|nr:unnamed protein product [Amoebophrya sp. A120]|eukprot:GSA120T00025337001.1
MDPPGKTKKEPSGAPERADGQDADYRQDDREDHDQRWAARQEPRLSQSLDTSTERPGTSDPVLRRDRFRIENPPDNAATRKFSDDTRLSMDSQRHSLDVPKSRRSSLGGSESEQHSVGLNVEQNIKRTSGSAGGSSSTGSSQFLQPPGAGGGGATTVSSLLPPAADHETSGAGAVSALKAMRMMRSANNTPMKPASPMPPPPPAAYSPIGGTQQAGPLPVGAAATGGSDNQASLTSGSALAALKAMRQNKPPEPALFHPVAGVNAAAPTVDEREKRLLDRRSQRLGASEHQEGSQSSAGAVATSGSSTSVGGAPVFLPDPALTSSQQRATSGSKSSTSSPPLPPPPRAIPGAADESRHAVSKPRDSSSSPVPRPPPPPPPPDVDKSAGKGMAAASETSRTAAPPVVVVPSGRSSGGNAKKTTGLLGPNVAPRAPAPLPPPAGISPAQDMKDTSLDESLIRSPGVGALDRSIVSTEHSFLERSSFLSPNTEIRQERKLKEIRAKRAEIRRELDSARNTASKGGDHADGIPAADQISSVGIISAPPAPLKLGSSAASADSSNSTLARPGTATSLGGSQLLEMELSQKSDSPVLASKLRQSSSTTAAGMIPPPPPPVPKSAVGSAGGAPPRAPTALAVPPPPVNKLPQNAPPASTFLVGKRGGGILTPREDQDQGDLFDASLTSDKQLLELQQQSPSFVQGKNLKKVPLGLRAADQRGVLDGPPALPQGAAAATSSLKQASASLALPPAPPAAPKPPKQVKQKYLTPSDVKSVYQKYLDDPEINQKTLIPLAKAEQILTNVGCLPNWKDLLLGDAGREAAEPQVNIRTLVVFLSAHTKVRKKTQLRFAALFLGDPAEEGQISQEVAEVIQKGHQLYQKGLDAISAGGASNTGKPAEIVSKQDSDSTWPHGIKIPALFRNRERVELEEFINSALAASKQGLRRASGRYSSDDDQQAALAVDHGTPSAASAAQQKQRRRSSQRLSSQERGGGGYSSQEDMLNTQTTPSTRGRSLFRARGEGEAPSANFVRPVQHRRRGRSIDEEERQAREDDEIDPDPDISSSAAEDDEVLAEERGSSLKIRDQVTINIDEHQIEPAGTRRTTGRPTAVAVPLTTEDLEKQTRKKEIFGADGSLFPPRPADAQQEEEQGIQAQPDRADVRVAKSKKKQRRRSTSTHGKSSDEEEEQAATTVGVRDEQARSTKGRVNFPPDADLVEEKAIFDQSGTLMGTTGEQEQSELLQQLEALLQLKVDQWPLAKESDHRAQLLSVRMGQMLRGGAGGSANYNTTAGGAGATNGAGGQPTTNLGYQKRAKTTLQYRKLGDHVVPADSFLLGGGTENKSSTKEAMKLVQRLQLEEDFAAEKNQKNLQDRTPEQSRYQGNRSPRQLLLGPKLTEAKLKKKLETKTASKTSSSKEQKKDGPRAAAGTTDETTAKNTSKNKSFLAKSDPFLEDLMSFARGKREKDASKTATEQGKGKSLEEEEQLSEPGSTTLSTSNVRDQANEFGDLSDAEISSVGGSSTRSSRRGGSRKMKKKRKKKHKKNHSARSSEAGDSDDAGFSEVDLNDSETNSTGSRVRTLEEILRPKGDDMPSDPEDLVDHSRQPLVRDAATLHDFERKDENNLLLEGWRWLLCYRGTSNAKRAVAGCSFLGLVTGATILALAHEGYADNRDQSAQMKKILTMFGVFLTLFSGVAFFTTTCCFDYNNFNNGRDSKNLKTNLPAGSPSSSGATTAQAVAQYGKKMGSSNKRAAKQLLNNKTAGGGRAGPSGPLREIRIDQQNNSLLSDEERLAENFEEGDFYEGLLPSSQEGIFQGTTMIRPTQFAAMLPEKERLRFNKRLKAREQESFLKSGRFLTVDDEEDEMFAAPTSKKSSNNKRTTVNPTLIGAPAAGATFQQQHPPGGRFGDRHLDEGSPDGLGEESSPSLRPGEQTAERYRKRLETIAKYQMSEAEKRGQKEELKALRGRVVYRYGAKRLTEEEQKEQEKKEREQREQERIQRENAQHEQSEAARLRAESMRQNVRASDELLRSPGRRQNSASPKQGGKKKERPVFAPVEFDEFSPMHLR